jgi:hypothetical protein
MSYSEDEITILTPPTTKKVKLSNEPENEDRLSDLPESVILHILSFLNAQNAVQTCVLSTRYNDLWKRLPVLRLHCRDFRTYKIFTKFVFKILSLRDPSITLEALDFKRHIGRLEPHILKRIVNYAIKHNVQRLRLNVTSNISLIPTSLFSFQSLTHLKLSVYSDAERKTQFPNCLSLPALTYLKLCIYSNHENLFPDSLHLPALTSLHLQNFRFCVGDNDRAEPFSAFNRLNSLLISNSDVRGAQTLCISSATLVNLTLYDNKYSCYKIDLRTPSLCTFTFCGNPFQEISGSDISSLKHVDIHAEVESDCQYSPPWVLLSWLIEFADIKSLTVTATTLQVL